MKILNRFLISYFIRILSLSTAAFIGIYLLIDFFEKVDDFIDHNAAAWDYVVYLANSIPVILVQILPLAILTTMVLTLGGLSRTNEVTAMRACGVSLWRIVQPLMTLALLFSFVLLLLNEFAIPWNAKKLNYLLDVKMSGKRHVQLTRNEIWYRNKNQIINITVANPQQKQLQGIAIFTFDEKQKIIGRQDIPIATYADNHWYAITLNERTFDPETGDIIKLATRKGVTLDLNKQPKDFAQQEDLKNELNFRQLAAMIKKLETEGYDATRQRVDMHNRIATPFTCLIMGFLGIPFALQRGRNSNIALGIGLSLGIGVVYFIIQSLVTAFGYSSALPPFVAAWTANFIFLLLGIWLLLNVKE
jgi:lipopolysaccharide export system permease protein